MQADLPAGVQRVEHLAGVCAGAHGEGESRVVAGPRPWPRRRPHRGRVGEPVHGVEGQAGVGCGPAGGEVEDAAAARPPAAGAGLPSGRAAPGTRRRWPPRRGRCPDRAFPLRRPASGRPDEAAPLVRAGEHGPVTGSASPIARRVQAPVSVAPIAVLVGQPRGRGGARAELPVATRAAFSVGVTTTSRCPPSARAARAAARVVVLPAPAAPSTTSSRC